MQVNKEKKSLRSFIICLIIFSLSSYVSSGGDKPQDGKVQSWLSQQHIGFTENKGQVVGTDKKPVKEVLFSASVSNAQVYITTHGITYVFKKQVQETDVKSDIEEDEKNPVQWCRIDMQLKGANINRENIVTEDADDYYRNYYLAHCPQGILGVKSYHKITVKNVYPGIDWVLYNSDKGLQHDFIVHPGANSESIRLVYNGASEINIESDNSVLVVKTPLGKITEGSLHCYQGTASNSISSQYKLTKNELAFKLGEYDRRSDLVIDPPVELMQWSTYISPPDNSHIGPRAICTDISGNVYITGYTDSYSFPIIDQGGGAYYSGFFNGGSYEAFIMKFNSAGIQLWGTYYGGSNYDWGTGMATDASGNLFLAGYTGSGDLPTVNPGGGAYFQGALSGGGDFDLFLCKFTPTGALTWATYYGGSLDDEAKGIDIDGSGNLWVTGFTTSSDFPTLNPGGGAYYQGTLGGGGTKGDAFILKFDNNGKQILGTYYGGANDDEGYSIKAAPSGNIAVTGHTASTNMPVLNPGGGAYYQAANAGGTDLFISTFTNSGVQLWSTYYGGTGNDGSGNDFHTYGSLTIDNNNNIYVTGATLSTNFPVHNPGGGAYFQGANAGGGDAFILKFRPSGVRVWATYYGGGSAEEGNSIVTDSKGNLYVAGQSLSSTIPSLNPGGGAYYQNANGGGLDMFITEFDSIGTFSWGTFFGGDQDDWSGATTIAPSGCYLLTGEWTSTSGITTQNPGGGAYYQPSFATIHDGFMLEFCPVCTPPAVTIAPAAATLCSRDSVKLTASGALAYSWSQGAGLSDSAGAVVYAKPGSTTTYTVSGTVGTCTATQTIVITVNPSPTVTVTPPSATLCPGNNVSLKATGATTYSWLPSTGLTCNTCANTTANPSSTITYTVVGSGGGCNDSVKVVITVSPTPTVNVSPSAPVICNGASVGLTASGATIYSWTPATGLSCTSCANTNANPVSTTTYTVVGSNGGCGDTAKVTVTVTPSPTVTVAPPSATICSGNNVSLKASGATTYSWLPVTGLSCTSCANTNANPSSTITYTVVGSSGGCNDSVKVPVTVNPTPTVTIAPSSPGTCSGGSVALTASGATTYSWLPSAGLSCTSCSNTNASPGSTTTYTVVGSGGGCNDTAKVTVTINPTPTVTVSPPSATICSGNNVSLKARGAITYSWLPVTGLSCTSCANTTANPSSTITYTVVGSNGGCNDTAKVTISVNPSPTVSVTPSSATLCQGNNVNLSASGATSYQWLPSTGLTCSTCSNTNASPGSTTTYTVVGSSGGCNDTAKVTVTINPTPTVTVAPPSAAICSGSSVGLTASGAATYTWAPAASLSPTTGASVTANPASATTYTVTGTSAAGCKDSAIVTIKINATPTATVSPGVTINYGDSTILNAGGGGTYAWIPATALNCITCATVIASPTVSTEYCVLVSNASGCTDSACVLVTVELKCGDLFVPNAFSPNGDGQNDMLYVKGQCIETLDFSIFDRWGNKVFETTNEKLGWDGKYMGQLMNSGVFVYYLKATTINKQEITKKGNITLVR